MSESRKIYQFPTCRSGTPNLISMVNAPIYDWRFFTILILILFSSAAPAFGFEFSDLLPNGITLRVGYTDDGTAFENIPIGGGIAIVETDDVISGPNATLRFPFSFNFSETVFFDSLIGSPVLDFEPDQTSFAQFEDFGIALSFKIRLKPMVIVGYSFSWKGFNWKSGGRENRLFQAGFGLSYLWAKYAFDVHQCNLNFPFRTFGSDGGCKFGSTIIGSREGIIRLSMIQPKLTIFSSSGNKTILRFLEWSTLVGGGADVSIEAIPSLTLTIERATLNIISISWIF